MSVFRDSGFRIFFYKSNDCIKVRKMSVRLPTEFREILQYIKLFNSNLID